MRADVNSALDGHLNSLSNLPPVAWPNTEFAETAGLYLRVDNLFGDGELLDLDMRQQQPGVYQISIFAPLNTGRAEVDALADRIVTHFLQAAPLTANGRNIYVRRAYTGPAVAQESHFFVPVTVGYNTQF